MNDDIFDENYKRFIKRFRNLFEGFSDFFDKDFGFKDFSEFPNIDFNNDLNFKDNNTKSYSISYNYQTGMDKPEIRVQGDVDDEILSKFLKGIPKFITERPTIKKLSLTPEKKEEIRELKTGEKIKEGIEPYTEITDFEDQIEICLELPGVEKEDLKLNFDEKGEELTVEAKRDGRKFYKEIKLPIKLDIKDYTLELKNGIACLKFKSKK